MNRTEAESTERSGATRRLTVVQRRHLVELADIRDEGNTGEAYFYPTGSQYRTAHTLMRLGFLRSADSAIRVYRLTDAGYEEARRGT